MLSENRMGRRVDLARENKYVSGDSRDQSPIFRFLFRLLGVDQPDSFDTSYLGEAL